MTRKLLLLSLFIASVAASAWPIFFGDFFATGDMATVYVPLESFFRDQQLAGQLPAWNADAAWGFPTIASAQTGFFYPPLLITRFLPLTIYFPLLWLLHVIAAGIGTYLFMKQQGAKEGGAFLAAVSFALSAFIWQHATHLNIIFTLAWLPWQFLVVDFISRQPATQKRHIALLALTIAFPFLAGQIQIPTLLSLVTSTYWLYRHRKAGHPLRTSISLLLLVAVLAIGLSAAQLAPTLELAYQSDRGVGNDFAIAQANQHSFPLYHLPTALFPRFFGSGADYWGKRLEIEYGFFIGTIPLLLALYASRRVSGQRYFIGLLVVSFLLALGDLSPFRPLGLEPSLWYFTGPARWLLFTTFAAAVLAGKGFDRLKNDAVSFARFASVAAVIVAVGVVGVNLVFWNLPNDTPDRVYQTLRERVPHLVQGRPADYYTAKLDQMVESLRSTSVSFRSPYTFFPLALLTVVPWLVRSTRGRRYLVGLTVVELVVIAGTASPVFSFNTLFKQPAAFAALPESVFERQVRVLSLLNTEETDSGALFTNPDSRISYETEIRLRELLFPLTEAQFGAPGAAWPASLSLAGHTAARRGMLIETPTLFIDVARRNIGALVVDGELPAGEPIAKLPELDATVYEIPTDRAVFEDQLPAEVAQYTQVSHRQSRIETETEREATLIVRDSYYPGWQATIDGEPALVKRADDIFRSLKVPAGRHTVELTYQPQILFAGIVSSAITGLILVVLLLPKRRQRYS